MDYQAFPKTEVFKKLLILFFILLLFINYGYSQQVENLRLEQLGDKIIIHFDFSARNQGDLYQLKVFQSTDGFTKPINLVKGDVGDMIIPGNGKQIEWYAREELGAFKGPLIVEIRVFESPENLYIQSPAVGTKVKRGKQALVRWTGGINEDKVSIQLLSDGSLLTTLAEEIDNTGQFDWNIETDTKPGKNYSVRILGSGSAGIESTSSEFAVARKLPIWLYAVPVLVVGGIIPFLDDKPPEDGNLPAAPDPN